MTKISFEKAPECFTAMKNDFTEASEKFQRAKPVRLELRKNFKGQKWVGLCFLNRNIMPPNRQYTKFHQTFFGASFGVFVAWGRILNF